MCVFKEKIKLATNDNFSCYKRGNIILTEETDLARLIDS